MAGVANMDQPVPLDTVIVEERELSDDSDVEVDPEEVVALANARASATQGQKKGPSVGNVAALKQKLLDVETPREWPWSERLAVTTMKPLDIPDVNDDLAREAAFYEATVQNVLQAVVHLEQSKVPYKRPSDYFAEMLKSDAHMSKVKDALLEERKRMDAVTARKRQKDLKKFSKVRKQEKEKERGQEKTKDDDVSGGRTPKRAPQKGQKRKAKDSKFGFGGKKKHKKDNTSASAGDMSGFNPHKHGNKKGKGGKLNRPGKRRREAMRK